MNLFYFQAAAILWTRLTMVALDLEMKSSIIPDSDFFFLEYSPDFDLNSLKPSISAKSSTNVEKVLEEIDYWEVQRKEHLSK